MLLPLVAAAQSPVPRYDIRPAVPPTSCTLALVQLASLTGPAAYQRLEYQLRALEAAQVSTSAIQNSLSGLEKKIPVETLSALFTGTKQAREALLCSASIVAKYQPVDETDTALRILLIRAYNQEVAVIDDLEASTKERFTSSEQDRSQATLVKDAERMTARSSLQSEAASTLYQRSLQSLLLAVDFSHPDAKDSKQTVIPCSQFPQLLKRSMELAQSTKSAYTDSASLYVTFLTRRRCKGTL